MRRFRSWLPRIRPSVRAEFQGHAIVKPLGWHPVRKVPPWAAAVSDLLAANVVTF